MPRTLLALSLVLAVQAPALASPAELDAAIFHRVNRFSSPSADVAADWLSNEVQLMLFPPLASYALAGGRFHEPLLVTEAQVLTLALSWGLKEAIRRPRPYVALEGVRTPRGLERSWAFPSGHASASFAGATILAFQQPAWAVPAYAWASLVSLSRIYNGVHYPSDVLGGALLGVGTAAFASWAFPGLNERLLGPAQPTAPVAALRWSSGF